MKLHTRQMSACLVSADVWLFGALRYATATEVGSVAAEDVLGVATADVSVTMAMWVLAAGSEKSAMRGSAESVQLVAAEIMSALAMVINMISVLAMAVVC